MNFSKGGKMQTSILRRTAVAVEKATSVGLITLLSALSFLALPITASAAELNGEIVSLSVPTIGATATYTITVGNVTGAAIGCVRIAFTDSVGGSILPAGMGILAANLTTTGTLITPSSDADFDGHTYEIIDSTPASPGAGTHTIILSGVTNSTVANTTYYVTVNTFSDVACTTAVDTNGVGAFVNTAGVVVDATVNPSLTFTVGTTTCTLGVLTTSAHGKCSHVMTAASNATSGYAISYYTPATLTSSGGDTITANGATAIADASGVTEQYGINLVANTIAPTVGANKSGDTTPTVGAQYNIIDSFALVEATNTTIATVNAPSNTTTFTVSYIANIAPSTDAGVYTSTQTYNITATY